MRVRGIIFFGVNLMRDKFKNKNGDLTHYALACGYVQEFKLNENLNLRLWHEGGIVFHVKLYDHAQKIRVFWHCFDTLTEARKYFHMTKNNLLELSKL